MSYRNINGLKSIQVMLKELSLYGGSIDGKWGSGSSDGMLALVSYYWARVKGGKLPAFTHTIKEGDASFQAIVRVQDLLKAAGLYKGNVDGIYGNGTYNGMLAAFVCYRATNGLVELDACWSKRVSKAFIKKIRDWVKARGMPPEAVNWLMACIAFETAGSFDPTKQNMAGAKYFGLIQFGNAAAKDLGTTTAALIKLSQLEQLDWVFAYFDMWAKRGKKCTQLEDFYLAIFYPAAVGKAADTVIFVKDVDSVAYTQNGGLDINKDDRITVGEINERIYQMYFQGMEPANRVPL